MRIEMENTQSLYKIFLNAFNNVLKKYNKKTEEITLIAVSKTHSAEKVQQVYELGQRHFGENYVQEALQKIELCKGLNIFWHFIGNLQRNKVKSIVGKFELIHSVDSLELAQKISQVAKDQHVIQNCLIQIHIGGEASKGGFEVDDLFNKVETLFSLSNIRWQGVMSMPPLSSDENLARQYLKETKAVFDKVKELISISQKYEWKHLSMGTSHDFEWAMEEGATFIRVGTAIFGEREYAKKSET